MEGTGMTRPEMLEVLTENLHATVELVNEEEIVESANLLDLGADSLEILEVAVRTMKQLGVRVPRTELSGANNIGDLLTLYERAASGAFATTR
jgi:acyl carrier protein